MELRQSEGLPFLFLKWYDLSMEEINVNLIEKVRHQDANAKKEVVSLTREYLVQTIFKRYIGLEEQEIHDILQATYTYAFMHIDKLSDNRKFLKWITVLLNKQLREYMQAKEHEGVTTALHVLSFEEDNGLKEDVDACLNSLPENQKTVTIMHCFEKLKDKDIASRLKVSEEGVSRLLKNGKQKVKDILEKKK